MFVTGCFIKFIKENFCATYYTGSLHLENVSFIKGCTDVVIKFLLLLFYSCFFSSSYLTLCPVLELITITNITFKVKVDLELHVTTQ